MLAAPTAAVMARIRPWSRSLAAMAARTRLRSVPTGSSFWRGPGDRCCPPAWPAQLSGSSVPAAGPLRDTVRGYGHPQAVDNCVDSAVESSGAQGINGRCPVDDKRILEEPAERPCVARRAGSRTASPLKTCSARRKVREAADPRVTGDYRSGTRPVAATWRTAAGQPAGQGRDGEERPLHL